MNLWSSERCRVCYLIAIILEKIETSWMAVNITWIKSFGTKSASLFPCTHLFLPHHRNSNCPSEASVTNSIIYIQWLSALKKRHVASRWAAAFFIFKEKQNFRNLHLANLSLTTNIHIEFRIHFKTSTGLVSWFSWV